MSISQKTLDSILLLQRGHDLSITLAKGGKYPVVGSSGTIAYHDVFTCPAPCITVGRSGSGVGKVRCTNANSWAHNTTLYIRDFMGNNPQYIYYLLLNIDLKAYSGGSAVPTLNRNHLSKIKIEHETDIDIQLKKAKILMAFDTKIEQILRYIQKLEETIQSIYQGWFNKFNYPNATGKIENGIPANWKRSTVFDNVSEVREKNKGNNDYSVLSVVKEGEFKISEDVFTKQIYSKSTENYKIIKHNQIGYNPSRANIGSIAMLTGFEIGLLSPIYIVFETNASVTPIYFNYYMKNPIFLENIKHHAIGTTRQNFPFDAFKMFDIVVPPIELQKCFEEIAKPIEQKIAILKKENKVLAEIRDALLPKLMNGELPVEVGV